ncbi:integrase core domain-containing protein [Salinimonas sediminis]|uniref:Integrase catalytic domain-containing protein n=1 Tax=Salinimonas sediminis TaxID=2303538 RepID=A0A346NMJ0_9ALTE|nr:hypothetical protein D0Y50_10460 [Salinimonas sediminis]
MLNIYVFKTLNEVRYLTEKWITAYNEERPNEALDDLNRGCILVSMNRPKP